MPSSRITVMKKPRGGWCVLIDDEVISDHSTHVAARIAANNHVRALEASRHDQGDQK